MDLKTTGNVSREENSFSFHHGSPLLRCSNRFCGRDNLLDKTEKRIWFIPSWFNTLSLVRLQRIWLERFYIIARWGRASWNLRLERLPSIQLQLWLKCFWPLLNPCHIFSSMEMDPNLKNQYSRVHFDICVISSKGRAGEAVAPRVRRDWFSLSRHGAYRHEKETRFRRAYFRRLLETREDQSLVRLNVSYLDRDQVRIVATNEASCSWASSVRYEERLQKTIRWKLPTRQ